MSVPPGSRSEVQGRAGWPEGAQAPGTDAQSQPESLLGPPGPGRAVRTLGQPHGVQPLHPWEQPKADSGCRQEPAWPSALL